jgi:hypothetical protein
MSLRPVRCQASIAPSRSSETAVIGTGSAASLDVERFHKLDDDVDRNADTERASKPIVAVPRLSVCPSAKSRIEQRLGKPMGGALRQLARGTCHKRDRKRPVGKLDDRKAVRPPPLQYLSR